ncbi:hypothetical protein GCM10023084_53880 [Streptomyces lacrimifluminis]|uniref:Insertion element IS402-like domain-containing protein n=1 Tax=Streptomyces lacrimifluminis TaxID=1500077 RepID=A0A917KYY9_9ACTN|nr:transposase [Streptomyces lacrimifluminis]GGJ34415.1 hypothetical protein GCM10012282_33980 [Streptomyces lacrimifluminis]
MNPYEPLANYLEPIFGNIYEYNMDEPGFDRQEWTNELREAVIHYLEHGLPEDIAVTLFCLDGEALKDPGVKRAAIDDLLKGCDAWEVAFEVRGAAVRAVPTLDQLIGHLDAWPSRDEAVDAELWLEANLTNWRFMIEKLDPALTQQPTFDFDAMDYAPPALLKAWHDAVGPAPSDLTDDEWQLLTQTLPPDAPGMKTEQGAASTRRALNGMLYRHRHHYQTAWTQVPRRYGNDASIQARVSSYKKKGVFARTLAALDGIPGAERLVEWLRHLEGGESSKDRP